MSQRSRNLPRRSCHAVPGSNEKFLAKAPSLPADMFFLDLEDAVAPLEKEGARAKVVEAIRDLDWGDAVLCVRVNAWDTRWTYGDVIGGGRSGRDPAGRDHDAEGPERGRGRRHGPAAHPGGDQQRPADRSHRDRGPDRDGAGSDQRGGDLCRVAPGGDGHPRTGRPVGLDGDAVAGGRPADPGVPGRLLPLRVHEDPDGGAGQRAAGDRRAVREGPGRRRDSGSTPSGRRSSATTESGACTPTRSGSSTRSSPPPRSSSTRRGRSSMPTARRPRATARARSCSATR